MSTAQYILDPRTPPHTPQFPVIHGVLPSGIPFTDFDTRIIGSLVNPLAKYLSESRITGPGLLQALEEFCDVKSDVDPESVFDQKQVAAMRLRLAQLMLTPDESMLAIAQKFLTIPDYLHMIMRNVISTDDGLGRIGNKSTGDLLGYKIMVASKFCPPYMKIDLPETCFLTAEDCFPAFMKANQDHFAEFLKQAGVSDFGEYKLLPEQRIEALQEELIATFLLGTKFPADLERKLRKFVESAGKGPFKVRSSSLLEDGATTPFAGIYHTGPTVFGEDANINYERLRAEIAAVYASTFSLEAIRYRKSNKRLRDDEHMGAKIQRAVGVLDGRFFAPQVSGVAHTYNDEAWSEDQKPEDGSANFSLGFGYHAVEVQGEGEGEPLEVSMTRPTMGQHLNQYKAVLDIAQKVVYVIDMHSSRLERISPQVYYDSLESKDGLNGVFSVARDGSIRQGHWMSDGGGVRVVTFQGLLGERGFTDQFKGMLSALREGFGHEVEIEFAIDRADEGGVFNLLQLKKQQIPPPVEPVEIPANIDQAHVVFDVTGKLVPNAYLPDVKYLVYVDPTQYTRNCLDRERAPLLLEAIKHINTCLAGTCFVLLGPGRWGTNPGDKGIGLPVAASYIDNTALLISIIDTSNGNRFETPAGKDHFTQNRKARNIPALTIRMASDLFSTALFAGENDLSAILPGYADVGDMLRVVRIERGFPGMQLKIISDRRSKRAVAFVTPKITIPEE